MVRIPLPPPASPSHGCLSLLQAQMPLLISDYFMQMAERVYGDAAATDASAAPPRWHVGFSGSDRRNSTCDVYNVRSSCLAGARQSRSAMPPKCSWKPHCTMSVFVLLVFCLIGHPGRMPGSGRRRNDEPGRVSSERSRSCCPLARGSSQMGTGQGSLLAWQPGASLIAARFEPMPHARGVRPPYEDPSHGSGICSTR